MRWIHDDVSRLELDSKSTWVDINKSTWMFRNKTTWAVKTWIRRKVYKNPRKYTLSTKERTNLRYATEKQLKPVRQWEMKFIAWGWFLTGGRYFMGVCLYYGEYLQNWAFMPNVTSRNQTFHSEGFGSGVRLWETARVRHHQERAAFQFLARPARHGTHANALHYSLHVCYHSE